MVLIKRFLVNKEINKPTEIFQTNDGEQQATTELKYRPEASAQEIFNSENGRIDFVKRLKFFEDSNQFLDPELTLNQVSKELYTTDHFLSKYLKVELDVSFSNYINNLRVKYVSDLLCHMCRNNIPIKSLEDIYLQAGFKSKSTFNRHFKRVMSQTPTEFIDSF